MRSMVRFLVNSLIIWFFYHLREAVKTFFVARPLGGGHRPATNKKDYFEAQTKFPKKNVASKLEGFS